MGMLLIRTWAIRPDNGKATGRSRAALDIAQAALPRIEAVRDQLRVMSPHWVVSECQSEELALLGSACQTICAARLPLPSL